MIIALVGLSGFFLYGVAVVLACFRKTRKIGLVMALPTLGMMGVPFVAVYGIYFLIPLIALIVAGLFFIKKIWND